MTEAVLQAAARARGLAGSSASMELLDRALRHQVHIHQFGAGLGERITKELATAEPQLVGKLTARLMRAQPQRGPWTTKRLARITAGLGEIVDNRYTKVYKNLREQLLGLSTNEAKFAVNGFKDVVPIRFEYDLPSPEMLRSIVLSQPFEGAVLSQWWQGAARDEKIHLDRAVRQGLVQGETTPQIVRRVTGRRGVLALSTNRAKSLIHTAVSHVSNSARHQTFVSNRKLVKQVKIVATLDGRTTPICRLRDNQVYNVDEGPRPPFHFNCRTTVIAVLKSWKELGIPLKDAPPGTRASMDGQVPADLNYRDWFKMQTSDFQKSVLGPHRFKVFEAGLDNVTKFANNAGRLYTLRQLYAKYPKFAAAARLIEPGQLPDKRSAMETFELELTKAGSIVTDRIPADATDYNDFLARLDESRKQIIAARAKAVAIDASISAEPMIAVMNALDDAAKKYRAIILRAHTAAELKEIAKANKISKWNWATKDELAILMSESEFSKLRDSAVAAINLRHAKKRSQDAVRRARKRQEAEAEVRTEVEAEVGADELTQARRAELDAIARNPELPIAERVAAYGQLTGNKKIRDIQALMKPDEFERIRENYIGQEPDVRDKVQKHKNTVEYYEKKIPETEAEIDELNKIAKVRRKEVKRLKAEIPAPPAVPTPELRDAFLKAKRDVSDAQTWLKTQRTQLKEMQKHYRDGQLGLADAERVLESIKKVKAGEMTFDLKANPPLNVITRWRKESARIIGGADADKPGLDLDNESRKARLDSGSDPDDWTYDPDAVDAMEEAGKWVSTALSPAATIEGKMLDVDVFLARKKEGSRRAFATQGTVHGGGMRAARSEIHLDLEEYTYRSTSTAIHEYGHTIEYDTVAGHKGSGASNRLRESRNQHIQDMSNDFMNYRAGPDAEYKTMREWGFDWYKASETQLANDDRFAAALDNAHVRTSGSPAYARSRAFYTGKRYAHGSTELVSMGLEAMWEDPLGFVTRDPEWANFIMGILDGGFKNKTLGDWEYE